MTSKKRWQLYVLRLEHDKWYVGITSQAPERRFRQHKSGYLAAKWTKKYKPLRIHDVRDLGECAIEDAQVYEGRVTRKYMEKYGDNNVRGGDLTDDEEYIRRFGGLYTKQNWEIITSLVLMMLIIAVLVLDRYQWDIRVLLGLALVVACVELWSRVRKK